MATHSNHGLDDIDITREEFKQLKEAFKKPEFINLLSEYVKDVNDPKSKAIYEKEIKQLEKERGVDATFLYPEPGYVIKTSVNGTQKAFINICQNELIDKPQAEPCEKGHNWLIPYSSSKGRVDLDKKKNYCMYYDVVFHPDSIYWAKKSSDFKKLVEDTSLSAVEDVNQVKLDRSNIIYLNATYKGPLQPSLIRRKIEDHVETDHTEIPNYPYKEVREPKLTNPRTSDKEKYTTPNYVIKHRKTFNFEEHTYAPDAKIHAAIPTDLVVDIELPLIRNAADIKLDITDKKLKLRSENVKYKLDLNLPYNVEEGTATFDKDKKKLTVTLPVIKRYDMREDSGIESEHKSSSEEDLREPEEVFETLEVDKNFLKTNRHYKYPPFTIDCDVGNIKLSFNVKNVEPDTVNHSFTEKNGVMLSFTSVGSGGFPTYYAFSIELDTEIDTDSLKVEVWDNNVDAYLKTMGNVKPINYKVGLDPEHLEDKSFLVPETNSLELSESQNGPVISKVEEISVSSTAADILPKRLELEKSKQQPKKINTKQRTMSQSQEASSETISLRRSILKKSRSMSECHDNWSSLDSYDAQDESVKKTVRFSDTVSSKIFRPNSSILGQRKKNEKKSKNRKKVQEKRRSESENEDSVSEFSDYTTDASDVSDITDTSAESSDDNSPVTPQVDSGKSHRRRGSKNRRKNASSAKQNYLLNRDD